jgi:hypothetical protein
MEMVRTGKVAMVRGTVGNGNGNGQSGGPAGDGVKAP